MSKFLLPVLVIALFFSFFRLGSGKLFDVDEAVFSEATKEMVQSGDWITPTYNGENRYDKPIFFYWLMAASYKIFGVNEFSARFPSALCALLLSLSVFLFAGRFCGAERAFYTAVPLVVSPYFLVYSHAAVTDMTLALLITLSLFSFYISVEQGNGPAVSKSSLRKPNGYIYGFYLFSALAFLTKGLIGILFPFGVAIIFLAVTEGVAGTIKVFHLKGIILFFLVAAPWYIAQFATNGREFFDQFFIKHHFKRYTGVISGHRGPVFYYLLALLIGVFPWISFLPGGIKNFFLNRKSERQSGASRLLLFTFIWTVFVIVFFSLSTTKLPNYILPALPALSILISSGMFADNRLSRYAYIFIAVISVILGTGFAFLSLVDSLPLAHKFISSLLGREFEFFHQHLLSAATSPDWVALTAAIFFALTFVCIYAFVANRSALKIMSALTAIFLILLSVGALPLANESLQGTLHRYSLYAKERLQSDEKIITFGINNPSIVFYSDRRVMRTGNTTDLLPLLTQGKRLLIISKAKEIETLQGLGFTLQETDKKYAILERK